MKTVHLASKIDQHGNVSALCFKRPRKINLSKETWTIRNEAVTCGDCIMKHALKQAAGLGK